MSRWWSISLCLLGPLLSVTASAQAIKRSDLQQREDSYLSRDKGGEVALLIRGDNPLQCGIVFDEATASVDLTARRSYEVGVRMNCNAPFRMTGRATNGALRNVQSFSPGDRRTYLDYSIAWPAMVTNGGQALAPQFSGPGNNWARGVNYSSGTSVVQQSGQMRIEWERPGELLAGTYTETFTVELEPIN
ncbi:hypothetical protein [Sphingomonas panaciterrae]|uniref:hypothetical protein n=1 Tax=Sphingomonas panaciterrae TaxID=1462999 RepID=UPI002FF02214